MHKLMMTEEKTFYYKSLSIVGVQKQSIPEMYSH